MMIHKEFADETSALRAAIPAAAQDPERPLYHFGPPARWMNDVFGFVHHLGYYHIFYGLNPYGDDDSPFKCFGHARSQDLVHWEHLPIALGPLSEHGQLRCNDGCLVFDREGRPLMFYTAVPVDDRVPREHWLAVGSPDLLTWTPHPANPILTMDNHGGPRFRNGWSDPYVFGVERRTFMTISKCVTHEGRAQLPIYEAADDTLLRWRYRGIMFDDTGEVVNVFPLQGRWVLIYSPYREMEWFVGGLDTTTLRYEPKQHGIVSHGYVRQSAPTSRGLYAGDVVETPDGRSLLVAWISGFDGPVGWNGCMGIPRELSLDTDGCLRQAPARELQALRGEHKAYGPLDIVDARHVLTGLGGDLLEARVALRMADATVVGLALHDPIDGIDRAALRYDGTCLDLAGTKVPLRLVPGEHTLELHLFLDRSVLEVFVNGGRETVTRCISTGGRALYPVVWAEGGRATLLSGDVWRLGAIW